MHQVAQLLKRFPWIAQLVTAIWRLGRPRYSAGVLGVVLNDTQQVLLVEHVFHPRVPWGLPGGWVDRAEKLEESLIREMQEELKLNVTVQRVILVEISRKQRYHIDIVYLCKAHNHVGTLSHELTNYAWFDFDRMPRIPAFQYRAIQHALEVSG